MSFPAFSRSALATLALIAISSNSAEALENRATKLLRGGNACLNFAPPAEWNLSGVKQSLKIKVGARDRLGLSQVSAILKYQNNNKNPVTSFTDDLTGSAELRPSNFGKDAQPVLAIELKGTARGVEFSDPSKEGIWVLHYVLELDPSTLAGKLQALKEFVPTSYGSQVTKISRTIDKMPVELSSTCD